MWHIEDDSEEQENFEQYVARAVIAAFEHSKYHRAFKSAKHIEISILFSNDENIHQLNKEYRQKDKPTNILSFPMVDEDELSMDGDNQSLSTPILMLGDLALAHETIQRECAEKDWPLRDYLAHLIIHGTLHLLGMDHIDDNEAEIMEGQEIKALASLGIANPYS
ncbi:rRNA maturation RNase YbeY [Sphingorhabdus lutea]|uniref:Endoribonuclease YbeY n=1 Tax=Sphingorhabdus lutea TaxID=1913578 RepID=A0A1L3JF51_9SPHN|nr:rRNA maturation RNase YbeY [Sphingorhabdus lutea]